MPTKLMSPYMAVGSVKPVARRDSQWIKREAAKTSYRAALLAFGTARAEEGRLRREAFLAAVARAEAVASELQADPLRLAATPVDRDPLDLA